MKSYSLFLILGLLALATVGATAFIGATPPTTTPTPLGQPALPGLAPDAIRRIQLQQEGRSVELALSAGGNWEVATQDHYPANDLVLNLLELLKNLKIDDCLAADAADLPAYRLTLAKATRVTLTGTPNAPDQTAADLLIGLPGPDQRGGFFRHNGEIEILLTFDTRISQLPVRSPVWTRMQMGLVNPLGLTIQLEKPDIDPITIVQSGDRWLLQSLKKDAHNRPLEIADPVEVENIVRTAAALQAEGIFPTATAADGMGFDSPTAQLTLRTPDNTLVARVTYGLPRQVAGLETPDGQPVTDSVVPMRVQFEVAAGAQLGAYEQYFNRKGAERLFWIRQTSFDNFFLPHNRLAAPLPVPPRP